MCSTASIDAFVFPLSFAQRRLWLLDQLEPGNPAYNISAAVRLRGNLDVSILRNSLNQITARHEILRTTFKVIEDLPVQLISPVLTLDVPLIPLAEDVAANPDAVKERINAIALQPFNLAEGPLLRAALLECSPRDHILVISIHHIIADGWSMGIFIRETIEVYKAFSRGRHPALPNLPIHYADFTEWERENFSDDALEPEIDYWENQLRDAPVLDIPCDFARSPIQAHRGARAALVLAPACTTALNRLAHEHDATLFMVLLAAFNVLLHRLTGSTDILVGAPVAGRTVAEVEHLIGCFLNTVVLRTNCASGSTFAEFLRHVRKTTIDAYSHQNVPFEKVLERLRLERNLSLSPLFQVFFNMLTFPVMEIAVPELKVEVEEVSDIRSKFDLTMYAQEKNGYIHLDLVYNSELFSRDRVEEMLRQYEHLVKQIAERPDRDVSEYSLRTEAAGLVLPDPTVELDDTWQGSVPELFRRQAERVPGNLAVSDDHQQWSYQYLDSLSNQLANYLTAQGVGENRRVAIYGHRSAPLVLSLIATFKAAGVFLILDPSYPISRLINYLDIATPKVWLQLDGAGELPAELEQYLQAHPDCARLRLPCSSQRDLAQVLAPFSSDAPSALCGPSSHAYISFTSGSEGTPKAVLGMHGSLTHFLPWLKKTFLFTEADRFSLFSALSHDPLHRDVFTPLMLGAAVCIPRQATLMDPERAVQWMNENGISIVHLTPAMGQLLFQAGQNRSCPLNSLRCGFFVGDFLTRQDVAAFQQLGPEAACVNYYGSTETQRAVSYFMVPPRSHGATGVPHCSREVIPLGNGIQDVQLLVINEQKQLAGIGEIGEIYLRSPHIALGYLNDPELSAKKFISNWFVDKPNRLYRTGDLGRYLCDGSVEALGRADNQVKIRGFRIELGEVESVLKRHPSVRQASVIVREDTPGQRILAAYVVLEQEANDWNHELRQFVCKHLPEYTVPAVFVAVSKLPMLPNGKLDRKMLPKPEAAAEAGGGLPDNALEEILCGIWADVLKAPQVGVHDNFFDLGGHSLLATQVLSRIQTVFKVKIPLRTLFEARTVAGLAQYLENQLGGIETQLPPLVRANRENPLPLSYAQERLWFMDQLEPGNPAFAIPVAIRLEGPLHFGHLKRSFAEVVRRHEVLRTSFPIGADGQPLQQIHPAEDVHVPLIDLSGIEEGEIVARHLAARETQTGFDLSAGPLVRGRLLRLGRNEHITLLTLHHIVSDGWSTGILIEELGRLYTAFENHEKSQLADLPIQYADFAAWQRQWLCGNLLQKELDYWRDQLRGASLLEFPTDFPRPARMSFEAGSVKIHLPRELNAELRNMCRREGVTFFMVFLAAFQSVLKRYSGQTDVAIGAAIANRNRMEIEPLIGFFVNMLVMRTDMDGDPALAEVLARVRQMALDAYKHQEAPFEKLVEELRPQRQLGHAPFFRILMVYQNEPTRNSQTLPFRITNVSDLPQSSKQDLTLYLWEDNETVRGLLAFDARLFRRETMENLVANLNLCLQQMCAGLNCRLSAVSWKDISGAAATSAAAAFSESLD